MEPDIEGVDEANTLEVEDDTISGGHRKQGHIVPVESRNMGAKKVLIANMGVKKVFIARPH